MDVRSHSDLDLTLRQHHMYQQGFNDGRWDTERNEDPDEYLAREEAHWSGIESDPEVEREDLAYWYGYLHGVTRTRKEMSPAGE